MMIAVFVVFDIVVMITSISHDTVVFIGEKLML